MMEGMIERGEPHWNTANVRIMREAEQPEHCLHKIPAARPWAKSEIFTCHSAPRGVRGGFGVPGEAGRLTTALPAKVCF
jgi:hypothetical protein